MDNKIKTSRSVARFLSENDVSRYRWVILERVSGELALVAGVVSGGLPPESSLLTGRILVDVVNKWILYGREFYPRDK
jgi:hypothetical protein